METESKSSSLIDKRISKSEWLILFGVVLCSFWAVYYYQYKILPLPLTLEQAGKTGFSEVETLKHVTALTQLGPHPVGSSALDYAVQYVLKVAENIKNTAHSEVDVEVDHFHPNSGVNILEGGSFKGKSLVYSDLNYIVLRISPKNSPQAGDNAILISSHIDTVFSAEGAGDCSSCVSIMMELARGVSQWAYEFKNAVIFLYNVGEEEGLNGAHSFITQHPWRSTIRMAVDLEAMGLGGKSGIFQAPTPWPIETYALAAKYPTGNVIAEDLFLTGLIQSNTDFLVYREIANLSGLDFAYTDKSGVYHTRNDKLELLKPGSLQHLGDNMLSFLIRIGEAPDFAKEMKGENRNKTAVYFDILGKYMVAYRQSFARMIYNAVIAQSLVLAAALCMGGHAAAISLGLSFLSIILTFLFSISFSALVAVTLPQIFSTPVPYITYPWLVVGLFGAPAFVGALTGQHFGYHILVMFLSSLYSKSKPLPSIIRADSVELEAEKWLYKSGLLQWLILLILGNYYNLGSTYVALFWLVFPAIAYALIEATLTPAQLPRSLKLATVFMGSAVPIAATVGALIKLTDTLIGNTVRFDGIPGGSQEWFASLVISTLIAIIISLTLPYVLSYVHLSGAKRSIILAATILFGLSLFVLFTGIVQPFTDDSARVVNVVHVVDTTGSYGNTQDPKSYVTLFSQTPGQLTNEADYINEGFSCSRDKKIDFVALSVEYSCWTSDENEANKGWSHEDIPTLLVISDDYKEDERITQVSIDTKDSIRWALAINMDEIGDFSLTGNSEELIPSGEKAIVDGWHLIQFAGGKNSARNFELKLFWVQKSNNVDGESIENKKPLLKLRTDVNKVTPKARRVIEKLPTWCAQFGKSTSPYNLAFLNSIPVNF